jgi:hypothetical protein
MAADGTGAPVDIAQQLQTLETALKQATAGLAAAQTAREAIITALAQQLKPSPDGTTVMAGSSATITDAQGDALGISSGGQIIINGRVDTRTGAVVSITIKHGVVWQTNKAGGQWSYRNGQWKMEVAPGGGGTDSGGVLPAVLEGQGYCEVFTEDWSKLDLGPYDTSGHRWYCPLWYGASGGGIEDAVIEAASIVSVGGKNMLQIKAWQQGGRWKGGTLATCNQAGDGLTFKEGYFSCRIKVPKGRGFWPGFWLISQAHAKNPKANGAELDIMETLGSQPNGFYGTLHRNSGGGGTVGKDSQNSNNWFNAGIDLTTDFHDFGCLWEATKVTWFLDGTPAMSAPTYDTTDTPMMVILDFMIGGWDGNPDNSTPSTGVVLFDAMHVFQKAA